MALAPEIIGGRLIDGSSFLPASKMLTNQRVGMVRRNQFLGSPVLVPSQQIRRQEQLKRAVRAPVAAISEDIIKTNNKTTVPEKAVNFKVRAVVTVRNKHKEDLKATIVKQLDSFTDKIGRNVVLELISTDVDPSKSSKSYFSFWVLNKRVIIDRS